MSSGRAKPHFSAADYGGLIHFSAPKISVGIHFSAGVYGAKIHFSAEREKKRGTLLRRAYDVSWLSEQVGMAPSIHQYEY